MKFIKALATVGALGFALAGCGGNNGVTLTPQPPSNPGQQPTGPFVQIERLSRPAIKEVFETFVQHQQSNAVEPYNDTVIFNAIKGTEDALRPPTAGGPDYGATLQTILYPDQFKVDLSKTAGGFLGAETGAAPFGGRNVNDDVITTELGILFGNTLSNGLHLIADDGKENNCLTAQNLTIAPTQRSTNTFPYLNNAL